MSPSWGFVLIWWNRSIFTQQEEINQLYRSSYRRPHFVTLDLSLLFYCSYAGDVEVNVEIKKYFCKAGVKGIQVRRDIGTLLVIIMFSWILQLNLSLRSSMGCCVWSWSLWSETFRWLEPSPCSSFAGLWVFPLFPLCYIEFLFIYRYMHLYRVFDVCRNWTSTGLDWPTFWISLDWSELISYYCIVVLQKGLGAAPCRTVPTDTTENLLYERSAFSLFIDRSLRSRAKRKREAIFFIFAYVKNSPKQNTDLILQTPESSSLWV